MVMKRTVILLTLLALLLLTGAVLANGPSVVDRYVTGAGGGHAEISPYILDATIGQAVVGVAKDTGYQLCSGFWCKAEYKVYLPLVLRNA
jgi:hypothetical protein